MSERHALLLGATGLVGRQLLQLLLNDARWHRVTVMARQEAPFVRPKLQWCVTTFDEPAAALPAGSFTDFFDCMGTTIRQAGSQQAFRNVDFTIPLAVAKAARAQGATHASVVSAMGADPASRIFYNRVKGEVEVAFGTLGFTSLHLLRPSLLLGKRMEQRPGEKVASVAMRLLGPLFVGPLRNYRAIASQAVAQALVSLAAKPQPGVRVILSGELVRGGAYNECDNVHGQ